MRTRTRRRTRNVGRRISSAGGLLGPLAGHGLLLAEYDFLEGADPLVVYDVKGSGEINNGRVGASPTWSAQGLTPNAAAQGHIQVGVNLSEAGCILLYMTPQASSGLAFMANHTAGGDLVDFYGDFSGNVPEGQLTPRYRDLLDSGGLIVSDVNAASWPFSIGFQYDNPGRLYVNGVQPVSYIAADDESAFQSNSRNYSFANNFVSTAGTTSVHHYALVFARTPKLTDAQVASAHAYMVSKCAGRGIPVGGPAAFTQRIVVLCGNSMVNLMNTDNIPTTQTYSRVKSSLSGAPPSSWVVLGNQAALPLRRPLAPRSVLFVWPTTVLDSVADIPNSVYPFCDAARTAGWKVVIGYALSNSTSDSIKNQVNARLDLDGASHCDGFADFRAETVLTNDGAFSNTTYFSDGTHLTAGASGSNTGYGKVYPILGAAIDAVT